MTYGTIKVDTVTFTNAGVDKSVTLSGLVQNPVFSGNVTVTGTLSGVTVTGTTANFTSGNFTNISGGTHTITSGVFAAGSAASPSITFTGDLNTGIYSPGADQVAISTNGAGRLFVDASGRVGVGASPTSLFSVRGNTPAINIDDELNTSSKIVFRPAVLSYAEMGGLSLNYSTGELRQFSGNGSVSGYFQSFYTSGSERLRITSTGALNFTGAGTAGVTQAVSFNGSAPVNSMVLDSSGRLGVGTSVPTELLTVAGNIRLGASASSTDGAATIYSSGNNIHIEAHAGNNVGTKRNINLAPFGGSVGVGTSSPQAALQVGGTTAASQVRIYGGTGGSTYPELQLYAASSDHNWTIRGNHGVNLTIGKGTFGNYGSDLLTLTAGGSLGIGTTQLYGILTARAATNCNFHIRTPSDVGSSGEGVAIDSLSDNAGGVRPLVMRATSHVFFGESTERARIDSSGRLLVGTSSDSQTSTVTVQGNSSSATGGAIFRMRIGTATPADGNTTGVIKFEDNSGGTGAEIEARRDGGTWSGSSKPSRLVFSVTRDGSASPTEALRVSSTGAVTSTSDQNTDHFTIDNTNGSYSSNLLVIDSSRAATTAYDFLNTFSSNRLDVEHKLRGDGSGLCDGSWTGGGADYAEYFEWADANPDVEDRRGISVVLDGNKIREAQAGEDPIGVISGNPSVVGDAAWNKWSGKYLRDEYGTYILDENGERQLNPVYDSNQPYQSREERPEWDCVGLMGKLRIRKGQITGSRWIKMRDISDSVEEWLIR